jgi:hypothetical protein
VGSLTSHNPIGLHGLLTRIALLFLTGTHIYSAAREVYLQRYRALSVPPVAKCPYLRVAGTCHMEFVREFISQFIKAVTIYRVGKTEG